MGATYILNTPPPSPSELSWTTDILMTMRTCESLNQTTPSVSGELESVPGDVVRQYLGYWYVWKKPARRLYKVVATTCLHCFLLQERSMRHPQDMYAMRTHTSSPDSCTKCAHTLGHVFVSVRMCIHACIEVCLFMWVNIRAIGSFLHHQYKW